MGSPDESLEKFPELDVNDTAGLDHGAGTGISNGTATAPALQPSYAPSDQQWKARKNSTSVRWNGSATNGHVQHGHSRQKSLGEALHTIRTRSGSAGQNMHEIADALKAPVSPMLIVSYLVSVCQWASDEMRTNTGPFSVFFSPLSL